MQRAAAQPTEIGVRQKVYVHLNKTFFLAGESVWFCAYAVDAVQHQPVDVEKLLLVELFNEQQQPVLQTTVQLRQGKGSGALPLSDTLPIGNYTFRAYTNSMKNEGAHLFYESPVTIVNTSRQPSWSVLQKPDELQVRIFPEGGSLVYGLPNTTAVWCSNQYGEGLDASGAVLNQRNDTIARFTTCCGGRAKFTWVPQAGEQYKVAVQTNQQLKSIVPVPEPKIQGLAMQVTASAPDRVVVSVQATNNYNEQNIFLNNNKVQRQQITNGKAQFVLSTNDLPEGLFFLLVSDAQGTARASHWWYCKPSNGLNIDVQMTAATYNTRQEVKVAVNTGTDKKPSASSHLSVSVFRIDSLQKVPLLGIKDNLDGWAITGLQHAAISEVLEKPDYLDLLLRTMENSWQGNAVENKAMPVLHLPQYEGPSMMARTTSVASGRPAAGVTAYLSLPGRYFQFIPGVSDSTGIVRFNLNSFKGNRKAVLQLEPGQNNQYEIEWIPFFEPQIPGKPVGRFHLPETWAPQLEQHVLSAQVQTVFNNTAQTMTDSVPADTTAFYGLPDKTYLLDDYTRFPTMEEVMREYVAEVAVRKRSNDFHLRVYNSPYQQFFDADPLVMVDGLPVFDINELIAMDPLKIKKLDVVTHRYAKGLQAYDGLVSYGSYTGNGELVSISLKAAVTAIKGMAHSALFKAPVYPANSAEQKRVPDQRLQLYWNPALRTNRDGKAGFSFFTSDVPGRYAVVIEGLAENGTAGRAVAYFEVVK